MTGRSILVAGVGNVFLGDDAFGVEVVRRLQTSPLSRQVAVRDFGIRGFDLAYALLENPEFVILVDAAERGLPPGTLHVLELESLEAAAHDHDRHSPQTHSMVPTRSIEMARAMGATPGKMYIVCCEPATFGPPETGREGLSAPVALAVDGAVRLIEQLIEEHLRALCTNSR
jgi:hydrogenase maturation protease